MQALWADGPEACNFIFGITAPMGTSAAVVSEVVKEILANVILTAVGHSPGLVLSCLRLILRLILNILCQGAAAVPAVTSAS